MIGEHRVAQLRSDKLNSRFETHAFHGKSTLVGKEVPSDYLSKEGAGMIKALTGSDRLDAEVKYGGKLAIRGDFYLVITSNARLKLHLQDDESAWDRRLVCYSFSRRVPAQRVPNFDQLLFREEGAGILNWLIEGYLKHRQELQEHGCLLLTPSQKERVSDLLHESRGQCNYLQDELTPAEGTVTSEELWLRYVKYAAARKWNLLSEQQFKTVLPTLMLQHFGVSRRNDIVRRGTMVRGFKGVMFKHELESKLQAKMPQNESVSSGCESRDESTRSQEQTGGTSNQ
jgi:phage/plasmid-associated DNA primase